MFIETIIAVFLLGAVAGGWLIELLRTEPLRKQNDWLRLRHADRMWADEQEARNLANFRRHLGTPYRPETVEAAVLAEAATDNQRWSRKATNLEVVS